MPSQPRPRVPYATRAVSRDQVATIAALTQARVLDDALTTQVDAARTAVMGGRLSNHDAHRLITALRAAPHRITASAPE